MEKRRNRLPVILGTIGAVAVLLAAFLVVWLLPHGPETGEASTNNPTTVARHRAGNLHLV